MSFEDIDPKAIKALVSATPKILRAAEDVVPAELRGAVTVTPSLKFRVGDRDEDDIEMIIKWRRAPEDGDE